MSHDCDACRVIFTPTAQRVLSPYLHLDPVVSVAQVLQVGGGIGLHRGEVMLQHVDDLRQLGVTPRKLPDDKRRESLLAGDVTLVPSVSNLQLDERQAEPHHYQVHYQTPGLLMLTC